MDNQSKSDKEKVLEISKSILLKYNIKKAGLFGSYAKGDASVASDVDILVEVPRGTGLFKFAALKLELEGALKKPVDLVSYGSIKHRIREEILASEQRII